MKITVLLLTLITAPALAAGAGQFSGLAKDGSSFRIYMDGIKESKAPLKDRYRGDTTIKIFLVNIETAKGKPVSVPGQCEMSSSEKPFGYWEWQGMVCADSGSISFSKTEYVALISNAIPGRYHFQLMGLQCVRNCSKHVPQRFSFVPDYSE